MTIYLNNSIVEKNQTVRYVGDYKDKNPVLEPPDQLHK